MKNYNTIDNVRAYPIMFSPEMVEAIRNGYKIQTRRIIKPGRNPEMYGPKGSPLWVRERWMVPSEFNDTKPSEIPKYTHCRYFTSEYNMVKSGWEAFKGSKARPSIFMPFWASRVWLINCGYHRERLQDISELDAAAEGIEYIWDGWPMYRDYIKKDFRHKSARYSFQSLWEKINGPGSWDENPEVIIMDFKLYNKQPLNF